MNTVYSLFQNIVTDSRDKTAIIENNRSMTFRELSNLVDLIAGSFPEEITSVGIVMSHRAEMIAAILAVLKCGARYVPAEPDFPTGRIRYMMDEANVDFILTAEKFTHSKPDPECFLLGAKVCDTVPENCVVFEDSFHGLEAGNRAKMTVVGLATTNPEEAIRDKANLVIQDFKEFSFEKMKEIMR